MHSQGLGRDDASNGVPGQHGYVVLFAAIAGGANRFADSRDSFSAGSHKFNFGKLLAVAAIASLISVCIWFYLGKRRGSSILGLLCRISFEPDSCVAETKSAYAR